jgi:hypothetical protein
VILRLTGAGLLFWTLCLRWFNPDLGERGTVHSWIKGQSKGEEPMEAISLVWKKQLCCSDKGN